MTTTTTLSIHYMGIDTCGSCSVVHHVFACSVIPLKVLCPTHLMREGVNHFGGFDATPTDYELLENMLYDSRTLPDLQPDGHDWCRKCSRPILDNGVEAIASNGNTYLVHMDCSQTYCYHEECQGKRTPSITWLPLTSDFYRYLERPNISNIEYQHVSGEKYCGRHIVERLDQIGWWFECISCHDFYDNDTYESYEHSGDTYCQPCYNDHIVVCDDCDYVYHIDYGHHCSYDEGESDEGIIHAYHYKPHPVFFGHDEGYHLGFELEIEAVSDSNDLNGSAESLMAILGDRTYFKFDGSVENGFEIVSHPHTLKEYTDKFPWRFVKKAKELGFRSWDAQQSSCGLHVHVSRVAFGPGKLEDESDDRYYKRTIIVRQRHEIRFIKLIYDNQRQIERLSGRPANRWSTFSDKNRVWNKVKDDYQVDGRYSAVNTSNRDTIEVRTFKGSLNKPRIMADIELVHCAVEYTRDLRVTGANKALSWLKFTGYVAENMDKYPHLFTLMEKTFNEEPLYDSRTESENYEGVTV